MRSVRPGNVGAFSQPGTKVVAATFGKDLLDQRLVGLGEAAGEGERDLAKTEFDRRLPRPTGSSSRASGVAWARISDLAVVSPKRR